MYICVCVCVCVQNTRPRIDINKQMLSTFTIVEGSISRTSFSHGLKLSDSKSLQVSRTTLSILDHLTILS